MTRLWGALRFLLQVGGIGCLCFTSSWGEDELQVNVPILISAEENAIDRVLLSAGHVSLNFAHINRIFSSSSSFNIKTASLLLKSNEYTLIPGDRAPELGFLYGADFNVGHLPDPYHQGIGQDDLKSYRASLMALLKQRAVYDQFFLDIMLSVGWLSNNFLLSGESFTQNGFKVDLALRAWFWLMNWDVTPIESYVLIAYSQNKPFSLEASGSYFNLNNSESQLLSRVEAGLSLLYDFTSWWLYFEPYLGVRRQSDSHYMMNICSNSTRYCGTDLFPYIGLRLHAEYFQRSWFNKKLGRGLLMSPTMEGYAQSGNGYDVIRWYISLQYAKDRKEVGLTLTYQLP